MIDQDEMLTVAMAMMDFGGGFVRKLGDALLQADVINQQKIKDTWPEYWDEYKKKGE